MGVRYAREIRMLSMDTATRDREIFLIASFCSYRPDHLCCQGESISPKDKRSWSDKQPHGLPSLGLMTVNTLGWLDI